MISLAQAPTPGVFVAGDETWRDIPGFPDYQASNQGRIRSRKSVAWRVLRQTPHRGNGYLVVSPRVGDRYVTRSVHRLITRAFLGSADGRDVNHINGNKHDNRLENLEYLSRSENHRHAYRTGLRDAVGRKLTNDQIRQVAALRGRATQTEIARLFGVSRSIVGRIHNRERSMLLSA
jgi:hypothetical protein